MASAYRSGVDNRAAVARLDGRLEGLARTASGFSSKVVTEVRAIFLDVSRTSFHP